MPGPLLALLVSLAAVALAVLLLRPERGWLWQAVRALRATERVLIEDALKHLFDCEYRGRRASLMSLSGALAVSGDRAAELVEQLAELELVTTDGERYELTAEGRAYALRVVRIHRLWERYLADETGLEPGSWHYEAEHREHTTSPEEAEALSASLGHPRFDPHGDPIPTAEGEIMPPRGRSLTELAEGEVAEIVHVEDEPEAVYAQLVAEGLHPGMRIRVLEVSPRRIRFAAEAEEHVLAPVIAANLSVVRLERDQEPTGPVERLSGLAVGESGRIAAILPSLRGPERRRILDLGLVPGTEVSAELGSAGGDPTGYRVRGAVIALRRQQADQIQIERMP
ncbi:MAG: iron dependent repressor, metal binding and dimerization domain protein [Thermoanaerobaculia bacterium]|nr:iron dependent repressor, metal binding and dimerization domain protein [Thermoanaerobaculia bacterium]